MPINKIKFSFAVLCAVQSYNIKVINSNYSNKSFILNQNNFQIVEKMTCSLIYANTRNYLIQWNSIEF